MVTRKRNRALVRYAENMSVTEANQLLEVLRWHEDQRVINDFDEDVWLGPCYDATGERIGITDCCFASNPCEHHRKFVAAKEKV